MLTPEMELLRFATRSHLSGPTGAAEPHHASSSVDWHRLLWLGKQHRVLPYLSSVLRRSVVGDPPPEVLAQLRLWETANVRRRLIQAGRIRALQEVLDRHGIATASASAILLAERYHASPGLGEVEEYLLFLVASVDRERASAVLAQEGYTDHPLQLIGPSGGGIRLGPRHHVGGSPEGAEPLTPEAIIERADSHRIGGRSVRVPTRSDWLLLLCASSRGRDWMAMETAFNIAALVGHAPLGDALALARRHGLESVLSGGIDRSHALLGVPRPEGLGAGQSAAPFEVPTEAETAAESARARRRLERKGGEGSMVGRYIPTPEPVVERMLALAEAGPDDVVYDLGSGDGRIVRTAATRFGSRGVGVDLDPLRTEEAQAAAAGVEGRMSFETGDMFEVDLDEATVVCLYIQQFSHAEIRRRLVPRLRPGTRIVTHGGYFQDWAPDRAEIVSVPPNGAAFIFRWTVPS